MKTLRDYINLVEGNDVIRDPTFKGWASRAEPTKLPPGVDNTNTKLGKIGKAARLAGAAGMGASAPDSGIPGGFAASALAGGVTGPLAYLAGRAATHKRDADPRIGRWDKQGTAPNTHKSPPMSYTDTDNLPVDKKINPIDAALSAGTMADLEKGQEPNKRVIGPMVSPKQGGITTPTSVDVKPISKSISKQSGSKSSANRGIKSVRGKSPTARHTAPVRSKQPAVQPEVTPLKSLQKTPMDYAKSNVDQLRIKAQELIKKGKKDQAKIYIDTANRLQKRGNAQTLRESNEINRIIALANIKKINP